MFISNTKKNVQRLCGSVADDIVAHLGPQRVVGHGQGLAGVDCAQVCIAAEHNGVREM